MRHLLGDKTWERTALAQIDEPLAARMLNDLMADFQTHGIFECVNVGYEKLDHYVASIVNPLGALRRLLNGR